MIDLISVTISQFLLLTLLFAKDKDDGENNFIRAQHWTAYDVIIVVTLSNGIAYLVYFLSGVHIIQPFFNKNRLFILNFLLLIFIIAVIRFRGKQVFDVLGVKKYNTSKSVSLGIGTALGIWLIFIFLIIAFGRREDYSVNIVNDLNGLGNYLDSIVYILMVVVIAPITEESIYRGMLYSPFRKKYGPIIAPIFNALLFAAGCTSTVIR